MRPQGVLPRFRTLVQVPVGARGELLSCNLPYKFNFSFLVLPGGWKRVSAAKLHQSSTPSSRCWWPWWSSWCWPGVGLWPEVRRHGCRRLCEASACVCLWLGLFAPVPPPALVRFLARICCFCCFQIAEVYVFLHGNGTLTILPCWCRCWATTWQV